MNNLGPYNKSHSLKKVTMSYSRHSDFFSFIYEHNEMREDNENPCHWRRGIYWHSYMC